MATIVITNPDHKLYYNYLLRTYGKGVATRYAIIASSPKPKGKGGAWNRTIQKTK